jgi:hypothetical protein
LIDRSGRYDIGVSGKDEQRLRRAFARPQVCHIAGLYGFALKAERRQQLDQALLAAFVIRRNGRERDQFFGER